MNTNTSYPLLSQRTANAGSVAGTTGATTSKPLDSIKPKPTYAEVAKAISPPAQSLISMHSGLPVTSQPTNPYTVKDRAPALSKKCKDVVADAAKDDSKNGKKAEKKKAASELAIIFEKHNNPIVLSGGKKPQKKTDWFSDIKIVDGPALPKKDKIATNNAQHLGPDTKTDPNSKLPFHIIEVSPDKAPVAYKVIEMAPKENKQDKKTSPSTKDATKKTDEASNKTGLEWATKKPLKKWAGDTAFKHPDVYLKRKPVGKVNPYNVLSGHGGWNRNVGYVIVPKGTSVTVFAKHGGSISDRLGNAIEHGEFDALNKVFNKTFNAGKKMPNYILSEPVGLNIEGQPTLTRHDVLLSELLEKNLGHVLWAACCSANGEKFSDYSFDVDGMHKH